MEILLNSFWVFFCMMLVWLLVFGRSLIFAGSVRFKNATSILIQNLLLASIVFVIWYCFAFSLSFSQSIKGLIGNLDYTFFPSSKILSNESRLGEVVYFFFQMLFALVATILVSASFVERAKMKHVLTICTLWLIFVYCPIVHWIWNSGGLFAKIGSIDFAGGIVVHVSSGFSVLMFSKLIGQRSKCLNLMKPSNSVNVLLGTVFVFIGWLGLNGGSTLAINLTAYYSILNTILSGSVAMISWVIIDSLRAPYRINAQSISFGVISGLVAISSCAAYVSFIHAMIIGFLAGIVCNFSKCFIHKVLKIDDSLDIFATHGIGGLLGAVFTGIFSNSSLYPKIPNGLLFGNVSVLLKNVMACAFVIIYSMVISFIIFRVIELFGKIRVSKTIEESGIDLCDHGEKPIPLS